MYQLFPLLTSLHIPGAETLISKLIKYRARPQLAKQFDRVVLLGQPLLRSQVFSFGGEERQ